MHIVVMIMKRNRQSNLEKDIEKYLFCDLHKKHKSHFYFREKQEQTIKNILCNLDKRERGKRFYDTFTIMDTGGGKSVCFQYPAIKAVGTTIVVSPLVSLINDQINHFNECIEKARQEYPNDIPEIEAIALRSDFFGTDADKTDEDAEDDENRALDSATYREKKKRILRNPGKYKLIYVTPEKMAAPDFVIFAKKLNISMIVLDEAHCVSLWGWDFRPAYLKVRRFIDSLDRERRPFIAAFTATATTNMIKDVKELLNLSLENKSKKALTGEMKTPFLVRDNIHFDMIKTDCTNDAKSKSAKIEKIREIIDSESSRENLQNNGKILIFCRRIKDMHDIQKGIPGSLIYYAHMKFEDKRTAIDQYDQDNAKGGASVMIATKAFGMGIDIGNIDTVIHFDIPDCIEEYYQQVGRAGRDRKRHDANNPAKVYLLYNELDLEKLKFMTQCRNDNLENNMDAGARYRKIYKPYRADKMIEAVRSAERVQHATIQGTSVDMTHAEIKKHIEKYFTDMHEVADAVSKNEKNKLFDTVDFFIMNTTKLAHVLRKGDYVSGQEKIIDVTNYYGADILLLWEEDEEREYIQKHIYSKEYCSEHNVTSNMLSLTVTNHINAEEETIRTIIQEANNRRSKNLTKPYIMVKCCKGESFCNVSLNRLQSLFYVCAEKIPGGSYLSAKIYATASFTVNNGVDDAGKVYPNLNDFDMMVADAIYTLGEFENSKKDLCIDDIDRVITGDKRPRGRRRSCENRDESIKDSINKLRRSSVKIHWDHSGMIHPDEYSKVFGWEGKLIHISMKDRGRGGWFRYLGKSPLNEYVEQGKGQQYCFLSDELQTCFVGDNRLRHSAMNMLLAHYILYRLWLSHPYKGALGVYDKNSFARKDMVIRLDKSAKHPERRTIYDLLENSLGLKELSQMQKREIVKKILLILDAYIKEFGRTKMVGNDIMVSYDKDHIMNQLDEKKCLPGEIVVEYTRV